MLKQAIYILAVIMTGLIAGLMWGTGMDQYTHRLLTASAWVTEHQVMDALFRRVMPPFWNASVLVLFAAAFLSRQGARWLFLGAAILLALSLVVTVTVEVPMNRMIALWDAAAGRLGRRPRQMALVPPAPLRLRDRSLHPVHRRSAPNSQTPNGFVSRLTPFVSGLYG